ncbi:MAG: hypothetical protein ACFHU9_00555 [Fluviicola sp.]
MFGLFKKKKNISLLPIQKAIVECPKLGSKSFAINIWIKDQILFQVMAGKHMTKHGLEVNSDSDRCLVHFFNKNKSHTWNNWKTFKEKHEALDLLYFEEPKGNHNYMKNIGSDPKNIEKEITQAIELYSGID